MKLINFEHIEKKLQTLTQTSNWISLQQMFNERNTIILIGHGGNMAVSDHGGIDIGRLTGKTCLTPSSGIVATSLISDSTFEKWLEEYISIILPSLNVNNTMIIAFSCSVGTESSKAIVNALNKYSDTVPSFLITARNKSDFMSPSIIQIITDCLYYHTAEVLALMMLYQLIHNYTQGVYPPLIKVYSQTQEEGCYKCNYGDLDHTFCEVTSTEVPPGFEKELDNIAIDFDGVLHTFDKGYHDGTCYGDPIEGSLEAVKLLSNKYNIIIYSAKCRSDRPMVHGKNGKTLISEWCLKYDIMKYITDITSEKPRAKYYIDDKAIAFTNNWSEIYSKLLPN